MPTPIFTKIHPKTTQGQAGFMLNAPISCKPWLTNIDRRSIFPFIFKIKTTPEFDKWLRRLKDRQAVRYITARIDRLTKGQAGDSKSVGDEVSELRIHQGPSYWVYFTRHDETIIILLCGGDKGTQPRDIKLAKHLANKWKDKDHG